MQTLFKQTLLARRAWPLTTLQCMQFTGKTESGFKFKTPKLRMRTVRPVPAPGDDLKIPENLDPETFCKQIGGDCDDYGDKFETMDEIFSLGKWDMKKRDIPVKQRKYIMSKYCLSM